MKEDTSDAREMTGPGGPREPRRVPAELGSLFWDCDLRTLDVERHREQILERVLQDGDLEAVRWALATYGDEVVRAFVLDAGPGGGPPRNRR